MADKEKTSEIITQWVIHPSTDPMQWPIGARNGPKGLAKAEWARMAYKAQNRETHFFGIGSDLLKDKDYLLNPNDVKRTTMYNDEPHCIAKTFPFLRMFCYCTHQLKITLTL